ncbi:hypothetical protein LU631_09805 [Erwinia tracheiphila]|uniref:Uncharacterized protein n=1 Tax=Erwinia tracheiphila TaxID=65700 RepID=A0A0M2KM40_9GAMM|nr:hypothetical protein [Erwinia tracheiphila]EOS94048.1 hypothetical protein ETR_15801 [Erwinia tracheiphila PSU-1]KKF38061.1 hypothetical protein SY86_00570 [Erwinia tracheiphila]UIA89452.1 hypothetical protein LU631_09805 [Erwinia tracheiphila]UIA97834.1 hypothetical protein LU633_08485 [Erwinia tracheiphila]
MYLSVTSCNYYDNGKQRNYTFNNRASAQEFTEYPGKTRFRFWGADSRAILRGQARSDMKAAIERHNKKWKIKS